MVKKVPFRALTELLNIVAAHPKGISVADIEKALTNDVPRRTLQYRLQQLVANGQMHSIGERRWAKYLPVSTDTASATAETLDEDYAEIIQLSEEAKTVRAYVKQPIAGRKPVGYNRDYLATYQPNQTSYLTSAERKQLADLGKSPAGMQPAGTYAKHILNRLLIDLAWNSSRLEGNTYSLLDTKRLIEFGEEAEGRDQVEAQMILNHKDAIEFLINAVDDVAFNSFTLMNLHALLSNNLLADPTASGRLRYIAVGIESSAFHPLETPPLIEECFNEVLSKASQIQDPFEQAFFVMVHLPYLQPFDDVNKRVSRLAANIPLIRGNFVPFAFSDVPQRAYTEGILGVYELNDVALLKDVFFWAYERSVAQFAAVKQSLGEPDPFRLKYRTEIREAVTSIILGKISRRDASETIRSYASEHVSESDRDNFVQVVEEEILGLHEGNFARYQVRLSEFAEWQDKWTTS
ncbi:Fic family protein [Sedimentitalea todarodis]|uniref:Fic family protein n=1 Tax=Sedimentitalea todarodis TaxID=1631240 RepID=A0ABU3VL49_9RHOB|nr:Fic family protein [Sedimentitalea todarodis]MDU9006901.1 Fic family protein [Sedimentitalea todarodis]